MERKIALKKDFETSCPVAKTVLENGTVTFMRQRELVDFAVRWIGENRK